jgi:hypothetical protein
MRNLISVLLFPVAFGMGAARAQNYAPPGSQTAVEPTEDAGAEPAMTKDKAETRTPETVIQKWPEGARATAREMISKYGEPSRYTDGALVWFNNGPWQKTVVYSSAWPRFLGKKDKDYLEQTIAYRVPVEKVDDLKRFDRRLAVNESSGQLSSRSESEPMNFLALNLADEIVKEKRTVEDARDFYARTEKLSKAGKSSAYMSGFLFPLVGSGHENDYDRGMMP